MSFIVLVAGAPAAGKTTFAHYLSKETRIPMASKDLIKERLYDTVGFQSRAEKNALGAAAADILCYFARTHLEIGQPVILESNFENASKPGLEALFAEYGCATVTVLFTTEINVLHQRVIQRDRTPERHRGHVVNTHYPEIQGETLSIEEQGIAPDRFQAAMEQRGMLNFSVGGERLVVDTTEFSKVSYPDILKEVREKIALVCSDCAGSFYRVRK